MAVCYLEGISCIQYPYSMNYATHLVPVFDDLLLYVPVEELVKPTYEEQLKNDASTTFPFWAKIWPASKAMSSFLQAAPGWVQSKTVLEIGAGIAIPSFVIAKHALEIIISDHAPEAIELAEKNIQHLGLTNAKAICLDWNNFPENIFAKTIILSDINYAPDQFEPLLKLIRKFLEQGSTIIIATPQRISALPFVEAVEPFIKRSELHSIREGAQIIDIRILVLQ